MTALQLMTTETQCPLDILRGVRALCVMYVWRCCVLGIKVVNEQDFVVCEGEIILINKN